VKPWMILIALVALLVAMGIWLVWTPGPDSEKPAEPEEKIAAEEEEPAPVMAPVRDSIPEPPEPEQALDQREVLRVLEEVAKNERALEDWDQRLAQACKNLIRGKKYEAAQQCYHLRLARNPEDGKAYLERGILHARMGKRVESYWDYVKFLELEPDHIQAPQVRQIVSQYEEWASGMKAPEREGRHYRGTTDYRQEIAELAKILYQEAYVIKDTNPQAALKKLDKVLRLLESLPEEYQTYLQKAERLKKRIESGQ
jgi:tetratricopeptide (TPR) repeat protein